jgi:hypothetical protein
MRPDSITLAIFEKFNPEELADTARNLVQALADKETAETEKKMSDSVFNERIKKHEADADALAKRYGKGGETAQIGCTIRYDMPTVGKKSYIRMDTEEVVEVHDMSLEEKQETLQFPLTPSSEAPKPSKKSKPKESPPPEPPLAATPASAITFKDIHSIAATIAKIPIEHRAQSVLEMQGKISAALLAQKTVIGPDGRLETVDTPETAEKLAKAWLEMATQAEAAPRASDEVTRICPYPGCILFADHDGNHEFPKSEERKTEPTPEAQRQPESKPKRKKRGYAPPPEPPCQEGPPAPGAQPQ